MTRTVLFAALAVAVCAAPAVAAPPTDARSALIDALDTFCKPYLAGADGAATNAAAQAAGWRPWLGQMVREGVRQGDLGRVEVMYKPGASCSVTVPKGGAGGQEAAVLDAAGAWAKKNGYSRKGVRTTTAGDRIDTVGEDWTRPDGGNALGMRAYVNRRTGGLLPDVNVYINAK